jgi:hypothetical protein
MDLGPPRGRCGGPEGSSRRDGRRARRSVNTPRTAPRLVVAGVLGRQGAIPAPDGLARPMQPPPRTKTSRHRTS